MTWAKDTTLKHLLCAVANRKVKPYEVTDRPQVSPGNGGTSNLQKITVAEQRKLLEGVCKLPKGNRGKAAPGHECYKHNVDVQELAWLHTGVSLVTLPPARGRADLLHLEIECGSFNKRSERSDEPPAEGGMSPVLMFPDLLRRGSPMKSLGREEEALLTCRDAMHNDPLWFSGMTYDGFCKLAILKWGTQQDKEYMEVGFGLYNLDLVHTLEGDEGVARLVALAAGAGLVVNTRLLNDRGQVDLSLFTDRVKGLKGYSDTSWRNSKTGWYIQKDTLGPKAHGGSAYKLMDQYGERIATPDEFGNILRK